MDGYGFNSTRVAAGHAAGYRREEMVNVRASDVPGRFCVQVIKVQLGFERIVRDGTRGKDVIVPRCQSEDSSGASLETVLNALPTFAISGETIELAIRGIQKRQKAIARGHQEMLNAAGLRREFIPPAGSKLVLTKKTDGLR